MSTHQLTEETDTVLHGKAAPGDKDFKKISQLIYGPANKRSVTYIIDAKGKKPALTIHCVARHADIMALLTGDLKNKVDLSHYDDLLGAAAQDVRFFLGEKTEDQDKRWAILSKAMSLEPGLSRINLEAIDEIATRATSTANAHHFSTKSGAGEFNAVREYGYLIPYHASKEFVGLELPEKPSFWLRAFMIARNIAAPGSVKLTGEITPASRLLLWSHMIFGHLFANIGDRKSIISFFASGSAKSYNAHIKRAFQNAQSCPKNSLLYRFRRVRHDFHEVSDEEYERHVRSIVFEFCGAMQILVGSSFANILATIYDRNIGLSNFLELLNDKGDVVLDEALRLNPTTTTVYRVATAKFKIGDQIIKPGELICLMIGAACKDPDVFDNPVEFSVDPGDGLRRDPLDYLNFGPNEVRPNSLNPKDNTHPCFGQYWARTLLKSMLNGLAQFPDLKLKTDGENSMSKFMAIPDALPMTFNKPAIKGQNFITVCSAIPSHKNNTLDEIGRQIEKMGNPALPVAQSALDACGLVHFISINIVEGAKEKIDGKEHFIEPCHIFMEISVDGNKDEALAAICQHLDMQLLDIYSTAGLVSSADKIYDHLVNNSVEMIQSVWPQFYSGKWRNGLGFTGTPGLSIEQIRDERVLAEFVENNVGKADGDKSPQQILHDTKTRLAKVEAGPVAKARDRWIDQNAEPPIFAEVAESPWKSAWDTVTLFIKATPDIVKVWTVILFLGLASLIWGLLFQFESPYADRVDIWRFPTKLDGETIPHYLLVSVKRVLIGVAIAFGFAVTASLIGSKLTPTRTGRMGAIFAFILAIVLMTSSLPSTAWGEAYQSISIFKGVYINEGIWILSLFATLVLAVVSFILDRKSFFKAGSAFLAFWMMSLLVLSIGDLQLRLLATPPSLYTGSWFEGFNMQVLNRWDSASLGQMIFYPLIVATILSSAIFAFNASYPKFRLFTSRKLYAWLFLGIFILVFLTSFASPDLPAFNKLAAFALSFILAIPAAMVVIAAFAGFVWVMLIRSERRNTPEDRDPDVDNLSQMLVREDENTAQNHMISVQTLLPEQWRIRFFLPLALHIVGIILGKNRYRPGFLASVGTVHFARWVHIANTNKFVFVSNYDGSWESYLEDFITKSATGMTGIWSNCVGFPRAKNLFFGGATDGDRFKRWARKSMKPTSFWYSAYPQLTAEQIRRNTLIRDGLARIDTPSDAEAWVNLIGSIPRPTYALQADKIQSLAFGGSGNLKAGRVLVIRSQIEGGVDPYFQKWVAEIASDVTFGDSPPQDQAIYLGFSSSGMARLGCNKGLAQSESCPDDVEDDCIKFPPAFVMGMDSTSRSALLGDLHEDNKSDRWQWGNEKYPAHAVLIIYGKTKTSKKSKTIRHIKINESDEFKNLLAHHRKLIANHKLTITKEIELDKIPETGPVREPFGYVDGISQPLIKGTKQASGHSQSIHAVNPGEFILGYKDNREFYPPSPQVNAHLDEDNNLPAIPRAQPQRYPRFQSGADEKFRDFGRNGTYLVIRQLEQDVDGFNEAIKREAARFDAPRKKDAEDMIKAKLMGRWPDGQPLTNCPVKISPVNGKLRLNGKSSAKPLTPADNEFLLGVEDPQGHKCPYGSHTRRANPRDGLDVENPDSLDIANRHRIMRRGRSYIETDKDGKVQTGTLFMCLNADIERQFEFIQQTWVGSCNFHGLNDEMDPITGQGFYYIDPKTKKRVFKTKNLGFTIQDPGRSQRLKGLKPFVTMRGGGYFFVPGREALTFITNSADNPLLSKCPDQEKLKKKPR